MEIADGNIEAILEIPAARCVTPNGAACILRGNGARYSGIVREPVSGEWTFSADAAPLPEDLSSASRLELELRADRELSAQLKMPMFQLHEFRVEPKSGRVNFRPLPFDPEKVRMYAVQQSFPVTITAASIPGRVLIGNVESLSPLELLAVADDAENLLIPGAVISLQISRPWQAAFTFLGRVASLQRNDKETRVYIRILDRQSIHAVSLLAVCECPLFSARTLWTYGLSAQGLENMARVSRVATAEAMVKTLEIRRDSGQFHGQLREANDYRLWSDVLDEHSNVILVSLGCKPVATARLTINDGERGRSEFEKDFGLPEFIWAGSFVEVSRFAIHPDFRRIGLRAPMIRELARMALAAGCRFVVFETIPGLEPEMKKLGAASLETFRKEPDSGAKRRVMYFDLHKLILGLGRASITSQWYFDPVLALAQSSGEHNGLTSLLRSRRGRIASRIRKALAGLGFSL